MYQDKGADARMAGRLGNTLADAASVRPTPEIAAVQERLTNAIASLDKQAGELVLRLGPVLHPENAQEGKLKDGQAIRSTTLGCDLQNLAEQVDRISSYIESTRNRLGI